MYALKNYFKNLGSGDMKVLYMDVPTGKRLKSYDGHNGDVAGLSLKPNDENIFVTRYVRMTWHFF